MSELERDNDAVELGKNDKEVDLRASDQEQKQFENKSLLSNTEEGEEEEKISGELSESVYTPPRVHDLQQS